MESIRLDQIGKSYKHYARKWGRAAEWIGLGTHHKERWVLQDVSLQVEDGEAFALIGRNGSGKSTLLKIVAGVLGPTRGALSTHGRVAALLELGLGFHPEMTGRANAVSAVQMHGLPDADGRLIREIEEFAEIGEYFEQPLRAYSTGMQMRLAFSVATVARPDILIVDEALAVGDIFFQQKCYQRIRSFVEQGTSLLFVSHDMGAVLALCDRAILLRNGKVAAYGSAKEVADVYQAELILQADGAPDRRTVAPPRAATGGAQAETQGILGAPAPAGSISSTEALLLGAELVDARGRAAGVATTGEHCALRIRYKTLRALDDPHIGFKIRDRFGNVVYETNSYCLRKPPGAIEAGDVLECRFEFRLDIGPGRYTVTAAMANGGYDRFHLRETLSFQHDACEFEVVRDDSSEVWSGVCNLRPELRTTRTRAGDFVFPAEIEESAGQYLRSPEGSARPAMLICETVNRCSLNCVMCAYGDMEREKEIMPLEVFRKVVSDYSGIGGGTLSLTPVVGDIFMDRLLLDRLRLLEDFPRIEALSVTTNCIGLKRYSDEDLRYILGRFSRIHVSVYGMEAEEHFQISRKNLFPVFMRDLKRLVSLMPDRSRLRLGLRLFHKRPAEEIERWIVAATGWSVPYNLTYSYANWGVKDTTVALPADALWVTTRRQGGYCMIPIVAAQVHSNGNVSICHCDDFDCEPDLSLGNVRDHSLAELFSGDKYRHFWRLRGAEMPEFCRRCTFFRPVDDIAEAGKMFRAPLEFIGG